VRPPSIRQMDCRLRLDSMAKPQLLVSPLYIPALIAGSLIVPGASENIMILLVYGAAGFHRRHGDGNKTKDFFRKCQTDEAVFREHRENLPADGSGDTSAGRAIERALKKKEQHLISPR
jgi:hypothetical protein